MPCKTAVVLGASGMIGNILTRWLLSNNEYDQVRILVRKPVKLEHPKLQVLQVNFDNPADVANKLGTGDVIFCCIGTTNAKVKNDKAAYRHADLEIPSLVARSGKQAGFNHFILVSAVGANTGSSNFYLKLKGQTEEAIIQSGIPHIAIFRPSVLLGKREEKRSGERIAQYLMKWLGFLFAGKFSKYKGIPAKDVAAAMIVAAQENTLPVKIYEHDAIEAMALRYQESKQMLP
jgi:uncharacterized protein YbjT (DUF2867 family)